MSSRVRESPPQASRSAKLRSRNLSTAGVANGVTSTAAGAAGSGMAPPSSRSQVSVRLTGASATSTAGDVLIVRPEGRKDAVADVSSDSPSTTLDPSAAAALAGDRLWSDPMLQQHSNQIASAEAALPAPYIRFSSAPVVSAGTSSLLETVREELSRSGHSSPHSGADDPSSDGKSSRDLRSSSPLGAPLPPPGASIPELMDAEQEEEPQQQHQVHRSRGAGAGTDSNYDESKVSIAASSAGSPSAIAAAALLKLKPAPPAKHRILLVEDSAPTRKITTKLLQSLGYVVDSVENGALAVDIFERYARKMATRAATQRSQATPAPWTTFASNFTRPTDAGIVTAALDRLRADENITMNPAGAGAGRSACVDTGADDPNDPLANMGATMLRVERPVVSPPNGIRSGVMPNRPSSYSGPADSLHGGVQRAPSHATDCSPPPMTRASSADSIGSAHSGTAVELPQFPYDLILMDGVMPVMDGRRATLRLRQMGVTIPIVGVTGNSLVEDQMVFLSAGANVILTKPVDRKTLSNCIEDYLGAPPS